MYIYTFDYLLCNHFLRLNIFLNEIDEDESGEEEDDDDDSSTDTSEAGKEKDGKQNEGKQNNQGKPYENCFNLSNSSE